METNLSFWWDLEKFSQKSVPSHMFFAVETILSFWWDLEKFWQKSVTSYTFFAVETILSFWWDLEKFRQKGVTSYTFFFRSADYLKFLMGLGKIFTKSVPSYTFCSLWRLSWVLDGTWKILTKRCDQLHVFAVQTILSFGWDLEKFWQKGVTSYTFFRSADYLKFLDGT